MRQPRSQDFVVCQVRVPRELYFKFTPLVKSHGLNMERGLTWAVRALLVACGRSTREVSEAAHWEPPQTRGPYRLRKKQFNGPFVVLHFRLPRGLHSMFTVLVKSHAISPEQGIAWAIRALLQAAGVAVRDVARREEELQATGAPE